MTTSPIVRLVKGARALDLVGGRYAPSQRFVPPPLSLLYQLAEGTSANRWGGAPLIGTRAQNRTFAFGLHIRNCASDAEVSRAARDLQLFLLLAGDEAEPLYLEFAPSSDTPEPLWGSYGTRLRYEIVSGSAALSDRYAVGTLRARALPECTVTLTVKPAALGQPQRLATATGGVTEDCLGAPDGISRGLMLGQAVTNVHTNPVFGSSTWNTGWTAAANLFSSQCTDPDFVLFGRSSAHLISRSASSNQFYQVITLTVATTFAFSFYAKRPDGAAVTQNDVVAFYAAVELTTIFTAIGNGWYRGVATEPGTGAAGNVGVTVKSGREVYVDCFQCEQLSYATPFHCGDMLGSAWTGTAHASTSTRSAPLLSLPRADDTFNRGYGSLRVVVRLDVANTWASDMMLIDTADGTYAGIRLYYQASTYKFILSDSTNSATSSAQTFSAGATFVIHATYGQSGLALYVNGVADGSNGTYTLPAFSTRVYLGTQYNSTTPVMGALLDVATWGVTLTAAQVAADYANIAPLVADGQRVGALPYLWTKDGDDVVDNADDGTYDNWAVAGGVPGSLPAKVKAKVTNSAPASDWVPVWIHQRADAPLDWAPPLRRWYMESSGGGGSATAGASGTDSNADYYAINSALYGASGYNYLFTPTITLPVARGKVFFFVRAKNSATPGTITLDPWVSVNGVAARISTKTLSLTTTYKVLAVDATVVEPPAFVPEAGYNVVFGLTLTALTQNIRLDYGVALVGRLLRIDTVSRYDIAASGSVPVPTVAEFSGAEVTLDYGAGVIVGDVLELEPERLNTLTSIIASADGTHVITHTLTYNHVFITPRWALL